MTPEQKLLEQTSQLAQFGDTIGALNRRLRSLELSASVGNAWQTFSPASGYAAPSLGQGLRVAQVGSVVHVVGGANRTGGNVGSGAVTLLANVPSALPDPSGRFYGSAWNVTSGVALETEIRSDRGIRIYGPIATSDEVSIQITYEGSP